MSKLILKEKVPHQFDMDKMHKSWGLCGYASSKEAVDNGAFSILNPTDIETSQAINIFENTNMVGSGFVLSSANKVSLYQGPGLPEIDSLLLLRYTREDKEYSDLGGEHISTLINLNTRRIDDPIIVYSFKYIIKMYLTNENLQFTESGTPTVVYDQFREQGEVGLTFIRKFDYSACHSFDPELKYGRHYVIQEGKVIEHAPDTPEPACMACSVM